METNERPADRRSPLEHRAGTGFKPTGAGRAIGVFTRHGPAAPSVEEGMTPDDKKEGLSGINKS